MIVYDGFVFKAFFRLDPKTLPYSSLITRFDVFENRESCMSGFHRVFHRVYPFCGNMHWECARTTGFERSSQTHYSGCHIDFWCSRYDRIFILIQHAYPSVDRSIVRSFDRSPDQSIAQPLDRSIARSRDRSIARSWTYG